MSKTTNQKRKNPDVDEIRYRKRQDYIRASMALSLIPDIGAGRIKYLFEHYPEPLSVFSSSWEELASISKIGKKAAHAICKFSGWNKVNELLNMAEKHKFTLITPFDDCYPSLLKQIYDPPALLWVRGYAEALKQHFLAIVGTRRPSRHGRNLTLRFTQEVVCHSQLGIVSGLANGIDTLAHKVTLDEKRCTVAVLGSGPDRIYPRGNISLAHRIAEHGGAVISEFLPGTKPDAFNFPIRNRIVSGMSLGVLVTETGNTGGSLITVQSALDQGREVFIVPHDVRNPVGQGCNELIQRGWGKLVMRVSDILEELPVNMGNQPSGRADRRNGLSHLEGAASAKTWQAMELEEPEKQICQRLDQRPLSIDDLAKLLKMETSVLLPVLLQLELSGIITQKPGKKFTLREG
ncbi:MAG: DNA-processing protein DprA [Balneolales bacterium]